jgi:hypothetical protein
MDVFNRCFVLYMNASGMRDRSIPCVGSQKELAFWTFYVRFLCKGIGFGTASLPLRNAFVRTCRKGMFYLIFACPLGIHG